MLCQTDYRHLSKFVKQNIDRCLATTIWLFKRWISGLHNSEKGVLHNLFRLCL